MIRPIIFNSEMVREILEGRKTTTRRCVKAKSKNACGFYVTTRKSDGAFMGVYDYDENEMMFDSPQTQPAYVGDILYVRETVWQQTGHYLDMDGETKGVFRDEFLYVATDEKPETGWNYSWVKRPSIHMPKKAARIFLRVKDVRVEHLDDMKVEDAVREGINMDGLVTNRGIIEYRVWNRWNELWDSTIPKKDLPVYGSEANPWVWVIEFERCEKPNEFAGSNN